MEKPRRDWKSLPAELLIQIFQETASRYGSKYARDFALVCKSWLNPARSTLYSNVFIGTDSPLEKFSRTVEQNPHIGEKVKIFELYTPWNYEGEVDKAQIFDLLSNILPCLPNLEVIGGTVLHSFLPILNALQDSQLKHLKDLNIHYNNMEKSEVCNYATCVLYMKDRIERIVIADQLEFGSGTSNEQIQSSRLYNRLHQFKNLKELQLCKETLEDIQVMEHVTGTCKSLKCLRYQSIPPTNEDDPITSNRNTSINAISSFVPANNIKTVTTHLNITSDYKNLLYLMHKFQQLDELTFFMKEESSATLNHHILTQFLNYLSKIKFSAAYQIQVDKDNIADTFGVYWGLVSTPGSECVEFKYEFLDRRTYALDFTKHQNKTTNSFTFSLSIIDSRYVGFIEKNGKFINKLRIKFSPNEITSHELPGNYVANVLKHCSNLRKLEIHQWTLKRFFHSGTKYSLDELLFDRCSLRVGALEQLSHIFSNVKVLRFCGSFHVKNEESEFANQFAYPELEIIMPETEIDCISFKEIFYEKPVHLMVLNAEESKHYYYRFKGSLEVSNGEEYNSRGADVHVYVYCKSTPKFEFQTF